jgi:hypothetical protein
MPRRSGVNQLLDFQINQIGSRRKVCEGPLDLVAQTAGERIDRSNRPTSQRLPFY